MELNSLPDIHNIFLGAFYFLLLVFAIQAVILAYHWFTYGSSHKISLTALAIYLFGAAILFTTLSITLTMI